MGRTCCTFRLVGLPSAWRGSSFCRFFFSCAGVAGRCWRSCCSFFFSERGASLGARLCWLIMFRIRLSVRLQSRARLSKCRICGRRRKEYSCATVETKRVRAPFGEETGDLLEDWLQHHTDERARGGALVGMLSLRCRRGAM